MHQENKCLFYFHFLLVNNKRASLTMDALFTDILPKVGLLYMYIQALNYKRDSRTFCCLPKRKVLEKSDVSP